jgi:hypothetical protein
MTTMELYHQVKERNEKGESLDSLRMEIEATLKDSAEQPTPRYYFARWTRWLGTNPQNAESELKYMDITAEQFDTLADTARKLGKVRK